MATPPRPKGSALLIVEGDNDLHTIVHLMMKHGLPKPHDGSPSIRPVHLEVVRPATNRGRDQGESGPVGQGAQETSDQSGQNPPHGSVETLIRMIPVHIKAESSGVVGFILDADVDVTRRWEQVRNKLIEAGVGEVPELPKPEGFVGFSRENQCRLGVWLWPDNTSSGRLENFIRALIPSESKLFGHVLASTAAARSYAESDRIKPFDPVDQVCAEVHCWLAWQEVPGHPFGTGIAARYIGHDSEAARSLVDWYKKLLSRNP